MQPTSSFRLSWCLTVFLPKLDLASLVGTVLAVALTEVALLFVMPPTDDFTTAECVVNVQSLYVIIQAFVVGLACDDEIYRERRTV